MKLSELRKHVRNILKEEFWDPTGGFQKEMDQLQDLLKKIIKSVGPERTLVAIAKLVGRDDGERYARQAVDNWGSAERAVLVLTRQLPPAKIRRLIDALK